MLMHWNEDEDLPIDVLHVFTSMKKKKTGGSLFIDAHSGRYDEEKKNDLMVNFD
jgi:hypothetical protein